MRRALLVVALVGMVVLAGCSGGVVDEDALAADHQYDWNRTEAGSTVTVEGSSYAAVLTVRNQSEVELYRPGQLGREEALPIEAVKFQYPNGTVVEAEAIGVEESDSRTIVTLPAAEGKFAYTAPAAFGDLFLPVAVNGSHEVILPEGTRMDLPIIGVAEPGGYENSLQDDRVHLYWEEPDDDSITVSYYLQRDLYIFGGLVGLLVAVMGVGWLYFRRQLHGLEAKRTEAGLDVEDEDR